MILFVVPCLLVGAAGLTCTMLCALLPYFGFCPATLDTVNVPVPTGEVVGRVADVFEKGARPYLASSGLSRARAARLCPG